jgi:hypothetical protein
VCEKISFWFAGDNTIATVVFLKSAFAFIYFRFWSERLFVMNKLSLIELRKLLMSKKSELQFINIDGEVWKLLILLLIWCMWNVFYPVHNCMLLISLWFSITIHFLSVVANMNVCFSNAQNMLKYDVNEQDKK